MPESKSGALTNLATPQWMLGQTLDNLGPANIVTQNPQCDLLRLL